ncbi:transporter [Paucibacter sp. hw1]|uniref:Transporter n=2 Tax=Roseateles koreensis TaxID=2987526 RepID=A0ABT5KT46_9BURK|nr:transporter [Roseateles koreensis]
MTALFSRPSTAAAPALLLTLFIHVGLAQAQTAATSGSTSTDAVRDALAKKEGDVDQAALLKATLTAADKQYSLIRKGALALTYDMGYAYIGSQVINAKFTDSTLTLFNIQNTRSHTLTNTISTDYGLMDNLTGNVTLPLVSKYSQSDSFSGITNGIGDLSMGVRWQPLELSRDMPSLTTSATFRLATGRSPFKTINGQGLGTGSGYNGLTLGANASKVMDPVAIFGSVSLTLGMAASHLNQTVGSATLVKMSPGPSLGFGMGFAYALSYKVSTTMSFQETISARSHLTMLDGTTNATATQTSGVLSFGLGVRASPKTTMNVSVGVGLSPDSPSFTLGFNMPLNL